MILQHTEERRSNGGGGVVLGFFFSKVFAEMSFMLT